MNASQASILSAAQRIRSLIERERRAIADELLDQERARALVKAQVVETAETAFVGLGRFLEGEWQRSYEAITLRVPKLDLRVLVPLDHIEPGQKMPLVVHLGPAEKTEWVDPASLSPRKLTETIGELVADLVLQPKWHQSLETQLCEQAIELARQEIRAFSEPNPQPAAASLAAGTNGGGRVEAQVH